MYRSTQLSLMAVVMLVALRLSVGWHFYKEGTKKYHDPSFTSAGFFRAAKGPFADFYHNLAGDDSHGFEQHLAQPLAAEAKPTAEAAGGDGYEPAEKPAEKADAKSDKGAEAGNIPEDAPYKEWAEQVKKDWRTALQKFVDRYSFTPEQKDAATKIFDTRRKQLAEYLDEELDDIKTYRHELHRLRNMVEDDTATDLPFQKSRIAQKQAELTAQASSWKREINIFEQAFEADLSDLLTPEQREAAGAGPRTRLQMIDRSVAYLHMGIGICLLIGLFSRLAGFAAAMFLLSVIATQPPWVSGAEPVYYQMVECAAALVLATIPTGRFAGLDFFLSAIFGCCRTQGK